jgi:tRNA pseudouridine13 synthase
LPRLFPATFGRAQFRSQPEDFQVDEILGFEPSGEGEHLFVHVRKRDQNTQWVAGLLAELAGIKRNDVSYCGMKDRFAVTTQWFSLYLPGKEISQEQLVHSDFEILSMARNNKKLRRGMHAANTFRLILREFTSLEEHFSDIEARLSSIASNGVPNYFGEQRFGHDCGNLHQAQDLIERDQLKGNRRGTGIYLSATRSWLFNLVLAERLEKGNWSECFAYEAEPSGPLWGRGRSAASGDLEILEQTVLGAWQSWCYALEHAGLKQERRALILLPQNMHWQRLAVDQLELSFDLSGGCFATVILREIAELFRPTIESL